MLLLDYRFQKIDGQRKRNVWLSTKLEWEIIGNRGSSIKTIALGKWTIGEKKTWDVPYKKESKAYKI